VLAVASLAQLMVVLDGTIVNIALPAAQVELGMSDGDRSWVVTIYALAFGSLLLLGGRIADFWGRKRSFIVGMIGFAIASAIGGLATSGDMLLLARALQGVFAALLAPSALALLSVSFPSGPDRTKAFAVFGTIAGSGAAVGLLLGGVLTEYLSWHWCLLVNVPIAIIAVIAAIPVIPESRADGDTRYDILGAVLVTAGLGSIVYGFSRAELGWDRVDTIGFLAAGVLLMVAFVLWERKASNPLLPLRVVVDRTRGGAFIVSVMVGAALLGGLLYLTFHFQIVWGFSPLTAGPLVAAAGLLWFTQITVDGAYAVQVLPGQLLLGVGLAMIFVPMQNLALAGIQGRDAGVAGAALTATQQVGGSIGIAVFTALYASAVENTGIGAEGPFPAFVDGYAAVFLAAAIGLIAAAVISWFMIRVSKETFAVNKEAVHLG
jgi:MFS family permease